MPDQKAESSDRATAPPSFPESEIDPAIAAMLQAAYGPQSAVAPRPPPVAAPSAPLPASAADVIDDAGAGSPVDAWLAAAVSRAIGSFHAPGAAPAAAPAANTDAVHGATAATDAASLAGTALTPLEQAVRDLVTQLGDSGGHGRSGRLADIDDDAGTAAPSALAGFGALPAFTAAHDAPARAAAPHAAGHAAPAQLPDPPSNPSHVHLVLHDGPERVVATVAVRGSEVHVALRASDEATAAALARNAGSLDHAMRTRGLALHDLSAEREPRDQRPPRDAEPRERRPRDSQRFVLEDKP